MGAGGSAATSTASVTNDWGGGTMYCSIGVDTSLLVSAVTFGVGLVLDAVGILTTGPLAAVLGALAEQEIN